MPSGRDSFRRNRVAPFVLFYFTTPGILFWVFTTTEARPTRRPHQIYMTDLLEPPDRVLFAL